MVADPSGPDPKTLWREQEQETDPVTLDQIHAMMRHYDRKVRFVPLMIAAFLVIVGLLGGNLWARAHDAVDRVSAILFILGEAAAFILGYRVAFPRRDPAESAGAYLRRRLQLKLANARGGWVVILVPVLPFFVLTAYRGIRHPPQGPFLPRIALFAVLLAVWLVVFLVRRRKAELDSKVQLEELETLIRR
jgi:hypothetical protein